jgi:hypothetical protein
MTPVPLRLPLVQTPWNLGPAAYGALAGQAHIGSFLYSSISGPSALIQRKQAHQLMRWKTACPLYQGVVAAVEVTGPPSSKVPEGAFLLYRPPLGLTT